MFMPLPSVPGIYMIRNIATNQVYVGSSYDMNMRWRRHKYCLKRGLHHSAFLQRSWDKHGEEVFVCKVLERCEVHHLLDREQHFMAKIQPSLNASPTAGSRRGLTRAHFRAKRVR